MCNRNSARHGPDRRPSQVAQDRERCDPGCRDTGHTIKRYHQPAPIRVSGKENPANEASTPTLSLPGTDPVSSKDASSLRAAASEPKVAAPPKREETAASESHDKPSWKAMALASKEKRPSPSLLKATTPGENVVTYGAKVRAFLARQPRAVGPPGSATVTFAISASGTLRYARIEHSSDNAALDEMALATVQNAAPFPPPPKTLNDEALSYSIQIGFRDPDALRTQN
jgi:periplasmic protein TonB